MIGFLLLMAHLLYVSYKYSKSGDARRALPDSKYYIPVSMLVTLAGGKIRTEGKVRIWKRPPPPAMPAEGATSSPATRIGVLSVVLWMSLKLMIMTTTRIAGRAAISMIPIYKADT